MLVTKALANTKAHGAQRRTEAHVGKETPPTTYTYQIPIYGFAACSRLRSSQTNRWQHIVAPMVFRHPSWHTFRTYRADVGRSADIIR